MAFSPFGAMLPKQAEMWAPQSPPWATQEASVYPSLDINSTQAFAVRLIPHPVSVGLPENA